jgi:hypothetical protein
MSPFIDVAAGLEVLDRALDLRERDPMMPCRLPRWRGVMRRYAAWSKRSVTLADVS